MRSQSFFFLVSSWGMKGLCLWGSAYTAHVMSRVTPPLDPTQYWQVCDVKNKENKNIQH